ncbi:Wzz/FepE/Etk N-terminal domain-containing protein [Paraherbaspirillum soli]|uniref:Wzz/FepE/Etk N-terminal domain-containing protein n=1 Tax=Paraherbaspirillum soli TaxID=631222 RepID=A0ABW0MDH6_9BURK
MPNNASKNALNHNTDSALIDDTGLIDLAAIWKIFKRNWIVFVSCIVLALAIATALWLFVPSQWQASATLQIGQMPLPSASSSFFTPTLIELPPQAAERVLQRDTENKVLTAVGLPLDDNADNRTRLLRKSLKAIVVKNTNFVQISVAAFSPKDAKTYLDAAAQTLIELHNQRMAPLVKNLDQRLDNNARQMTEAKAERGRLETALASANESKSGAQFAPSVIAINLLAKQDEQIRNLTAERAPMIDLRTPTNTFPTSVIDSAFVPDSPYFPKLPLFLIVGLILGGAFGALLALYRDRQREEILP